jgi:hydrogenase expression/formation protein HypD
VSMLVAQVERKEARVEIAYRRGVRPEGNPEALKIMEEVFEPGPARWRGLGEIPDSGLKLCSEYQRFDAELAFDITMEPAQEPAGCLCGEVLRGVKTPLDCSLFAKVCTPERPVGPCMVSSEGSCSAYYLYGGDLGRG